MFFRNTNSFDANDSSQFIEVMETNAEDENNIEKQGGLHVEEEYLTFSIYSSKSQNSGNMSRLIVALEICNLLEKSGKTLLVHSPWNIRCVESDQIFQQTRKSGKTLTLTLQLRRQLFRHRILPI